MVKVNSFPLKLKNLVKFKCQGNKLKWDIIYQIFELTMSSISLPLELRGLPGHHQQVQANLQQIPESWNKKRNTHQGTLIPLLLHMNWLCLSKLQGKWVVVSPVFYLFLHIVGRVRSSKIVVLWNWNHVSLEVLKIRQKIINFHVLIFL